MNCPGLFILKWKKEFSHPWVRNYDQRLLFSFSSFELQTLH